MKYRIQLTIDGDLLGPLIGLAFEKCKGKYDPDPKIYPVPEGLTTPHRAESLPSEPKPKRRSATSSAQRQEVLERALKTGPKRWSELRGAIGEAGLPQGTLNSLISKWQTEGKIRRSPEGLWSLVEHAQATA